MQFAKYIRVSIAQIYDISRPRISAYFFLGRKWFFLTLSDQSTIWVSFIHMKMLQDFVCVYWRVNKNSISKVFNLQVKTKFSFYTNFSPQTHSLNNWWFCELFRSFYNIYRNSSKSGFSFLNAWTNMDFS